MIYETAGSGIDAKPSSWWEGQGNLNTTAGPILGVTTILPFVVGEDGSELIYRGFEASPADHCDYCGNRSALRDRRGNCPSCGAPR
jgi:hypothetical protein